MARRRRRPAAAPPPKEREPAQSVTKAKKRYRVEVVASAAKALAEIPRADQERIRNRIDALAEAPRPHGVKALQGGEGLLRIRVGDYRIVYRVDDDALLVTVVRIAHRREAYR
jgi:mRNA interferase RelE/StbE